MGGEGGRFAHVPEEFREVLASMQAVAGNQLEQLLMIPNEWSQIFEHGKPTGSHKIELVFTAPVDFVANFAGALRRTTKRVQERRGL